MNCLRRWICGALIVPWMAPAALSQQEVAPLVAQSGGKESPGRSSVDDETTIRANADKYVELYNKRDAKGVAAMWSPEAVYTDSTSGEQFVGREAIAEHFAQVLAGMEGAKLAVTVDSVEFVSPNVAIERGSAVVTSAEQDMEETNYSAVHVKRDGQWLVDRISEEVVTPPPPSHYEHLKALEWMVGSWFDQDDEATVETEVEWAKNQNFLRRSFAVVIGEQVTLSGVQIIGWDPNEQCIRSWTFDSDGGFAEATWSQKGPAWHIRNKAVLPGGGVASAVNIMTLVDEDSFLWESINREADGELLPNVDPVLIVRANGAMAHASQLELQPAIGGASDVANP